MGEVFGTERGKGGGGCLGRLGSNGVARTGLRKGGGRLVSLRLKGGGERGQRSGRGRGRRWG